MVPAKLINPVEDEGLIAHDIASRLEALGGFDRGYDLVAQSFQAGGDIVGDQPLVFDYEHFCKVRGLHVYLSGPTFWETTAKCRSRFAL